MIEHSTEYRNAITADARKIYIKAAIDISDPDMVLPDPTATSTAPWTKPAELHDKVMDSPARYSTLEPGRWLLDGSVDIFPDDYQVPESMGYTMDALSGEDGTFSEPQVLTQPIENTAVLQAMSVYFSSDVTDGVPVDFTVEIVQGETAYFTQTITGNAATKLGFDGFTVYNPDYIRLTITKWSLPGRRVRVVEVIPGIYEEWTGDQIAAFDVEQNGDFSCLTLPYGSCDISLDNLDRRFEPRNKNGIFQSVEERQKIDVSIGARLDNGTVDYKRLGSYYQFSDGWKTGDNAITMDWSLVDIVGLLANREFIPPGTLPTTLEGWIQAFVSQLGDNFATRYHVDPDYASVACTASLADVQGKSVGELLRYACMATGTWPRADAETGYLTAEPLWNQGNKYDLDNMTVYPVMKANTSIAALIFTLNDGNNTQYVVSGNQTASEQTVSINNPFIHSSAEALTAARLILSCYGGNTMEITGRGDPSSEIGDVDTVWLNESTATTGRRMKQGFTFSNGVMRGCKATLLQADGSYLFEEFAVISESGKWKAPAGVTTLRVVIGSGGQGGGKGTAGTMGVGSSDYSTGSPGYDGDTGPNGSGGRIWAGTININPEQEFDVHIGAGGKAADAEGVQGALGEDTTFGEYSSAFGEVFPIGYSDIANGASYGRTGVKDPKPGSSDGGAGGEGGSAGMEIFAGTRPIYNDQGEQIGFEVIYSTLVKPTEGKKGVDGASGFVLVYWDKEDT